MFLSGSDDVPEPVHMLSHLGMLQVLKTGHPGLDLCLFLGLPFMFNLAFKYGKQFIQVAPRLLLQLLRGRIIYRDITYVRYTNQYGWIINEGMSRNQILHKAILHYLTHLQLKYRTAQIKLMAVKEKSTFDETSWERSYGSTTDQLRAYDVNSAPPPGRWVRVTKDVHLRIDESEDIGPGGEDGAKLLKTMVKFTFKADRKCDHSSYNTNAVDDFITSAFNWYIEENAKKADVGRFQYVIDSSAAKKHSSKNGESKEPSDSNDKEMQSYSGIRYKRYLLSGQKRFTSLFFPEKMKLVHLLDQFQSKSGKYAIDGYPHKLGILLHGPPGTGKTSLIKAVAEYTNRHVVSIPLSRIETNQDLMDIVYDQCYHVVGEDLPIRLPLRNVIFVMEDIDCATHIVHRRKPGTSATISQPSEDSATSAITNEVVEKGNALDTPNNTALLSGSSNVDQMTDLCEPIDSFGDNTEKDEAKLLDEKEQAKLLGKNTNRIEEVERDQALSKSVSSLVPPITDTHGDTVPITAWLRDAYLKSLAADNGVMTTDRCTCDNNNDNNNDKSSEPEQEFSDAEESSDDEGTTLAKLLSLTSSDENKRRKRKKLKSYRKDKLNLAGLLNVIDGVVDTPNRILIMTSNHPNDLDEALIRPGRIDKVIKMDYICPEEAIHMINHYFAPINYPDDNAAEVEVKKNICVASASNGTDPDQVISNSIRWQQEKARMEQKLKSETALRVPPQVITDEQVKRIQSLFNNCKEPKITAARVEQMCIEFDTVAEFLDALEYRIGIQDTQEF